MARAIDAVTEPGSPPLLEREAALAAFERALADAAGGRGRLLVVVGEAGIGKSALVGHVAGALRVGRVLLGACEPLGPR